MSTEQNRSVVRRYIEDVWGKGQANLLPQLISSDICDHNPAPGQPRGVEGQGWVLEQFRRAVPDLQLTLDQLVAEGDWVADRWTCWGTQTGELFGMPASGKRFCMTGTDLNRLVNGKITEMWHLEDTLGMMQQLGVVPAPPQSNMSAVQPAPAKAAPRSGAKTLSADEKRSLIRRRFQELIDRNNLDAVDTLYTPDFVGHFSASPPVHGRDEFKKYISAYDEAISNHHAEVDEMIVEGDLVACRVTFSGRHTGELMGIAPTGKQIMVTGLYIFRFEGNQIAEQWSNNDDIGILQQLGAIPAMAGAEVATPC